jgi:hypothetical protein
MPGDAALSIETEQEVMASEDTPVPHLLLMMDSLTPVQDLQPLAERAGGLFMDGAGGFLSGVPFDRLFLRRQHRRGKCVRGYVISRRQSRPAAITFNADARRSAPRRRQGVIAPPVRLRLASTSRRLIRRRAVLQCN